MLSCVLLLAAAQAQPVRAPAPGVLLVAGEQMTDPRFQQSVLLIIEHDRTGSWGVVINKPTEVGIADMLPAVEVPEDARDIYFGGPVQLDRLLFLYREEGPKAGNHDTGLRGVHWSSSRDLLERKLAARPEAVRVYAGYAGWAPGQLRFELARGDWKMIQGRADNVFSDRPQRLWHRLTDVLGGIAI